MKISKEKWSDVKWTEMQVKRKNEKKKCDDKESFINLPRVADLYTIPGHTKSLYHNIK